jgi:hypothetical protein
MTVRLTGAMSMRQNDFAGMSRASSIAARSAGVAVATVRAVGTGAQGATFAAWVAGRANDGAGRGAGRTAGAWRAAASPDSAVSSDTADAGEAQVTAEQATHTAGAAMTSVATVATGTAMAPVATLTTVAALTRAVTRKLTSVLDPWAGATSTTRAAWTPDIAVAADRATTAGTAHATIAEQESAATAGAAVSPATTGTTRGTGSAGASGPPSARLGAAAVLIRRATVAAGAADGACSAEATVPSIAALSGVTHGDSPSTARAARGAGPTCAAVATNATETLVVRVDGSAATPVATRRAGATGTAFTTRAPVDDRTILIDWVIRTAGTSATPTSATDLPNLSPILPGGSGTGVVGAATWRLGVRRRGGSLVDAGRAGDAVRAESARPAVTPHPRIAAGPTVAAAEARRDRRSAIAADPTVAAQEPAGPTVAAVRTGPAGTAAAAVAPQPSGPTVTARNPGVGSGCATTAVAVHEPAGPTVLARCSAIGTVTDQRSPQQRLGGSIDQAEQVLLNIRDLRAGIGCRARGHRLHKVGMKRRGLRAEGLICPCVRT